MDGSGKSTLAQMLAAELAARGMKSRYAYGRFRPRMIKPLAAIGHALFLRNQDVYQDYSGYSATRKALFRNRFLAFTYENLLLLDYCLQTILRVRIPLARGQSLICDRYDQRENLSICKPFNICFRSVDVTERCLLCPNNQR